MKMKSIFKRILILFVSIFSFTQVSANGVQPGWYGEATFGGTYLYWLFETSPSNYSVYGFDGIGGSLAAGYRFHSGFGLEGGFIRAAVSMATFSEQNNLVTLEGKSQITAPYLAARWDAHLGDSGFSIIPKLGVMHVSSPAQTLSKTEDNIVYTGTIEGVSVFLPFMGLGLGYDINNKVTINMQYQGFLLGILDVGLLSAGLTYHF